MSFKSGILSTFISKVGVAGLGLLMVILVSRLLGAEGRGNTGLFMSSVALLQIFCDFGNSSVIINLSYTHPQRRLWFTALIWISGVCAFSYPILYFFSYLPFVMLIPPAALLLSLINLNNLILMGARQAGKRNISILVMPALFIPAFLIIYYFFDSGINAYPAGLFMALIISLAVSSRMVSPMLKGNAEVFGFEKEILKQGVWVQGAQALQFLNYRLNFFFVAFVLGDAALGIYNNAVILCESVWILGHSIGQMQHMRILNTVDEKAQIILSNKLIIYNFTGSLVLCLLLLLIPVSFWIRLFSVEFSEMSKLFVYLIPGVLCFSVSNIINHYMHAKNLFSQILMINASGLVAGTILSVILIPAMGLPGACMGWSAGLAASMIFYLIRYKITVNKVYGKA